MRPALALAIAIAFLAGLAEAAPPDRQLIEDLVAANRILAMEGVLDGYGHVSVRHDKDPGRYLMSRYIAPALVTAADIVEYDLDSTALEPKGAPSYTERFIHGEIYKARPDVKAIVHNHSPALIPFGISGVALRPVFHMSAFVGQGVPVFEIRESGGMTDMLVRSPALGEALAKTLGNHPAALMRGHGAVVVGPTLPLVVGRSVYLETNARLQAQAAAMGNSLTFLDAEEVRKVEARQDYKRAWEIWKRKAMAK